MAPGLGQLYVSLEAAAHSLETFSEEWLLSANRPLEQCPVWSVKPEFASAVPAAVLDSCRSRCVSAVGVRDALDAVEADQLVLARQQSDKITKLQPWLSSMVGDRTLHSAIQREGSGLQLPGYVACANAPVVDRAFVEAEAAAGRTVFMMQAPPGRSNARLNGSFGPCYQGVGQGSWVPVTGQQHLHAQRSNNFGGILRGHLLYDAVLPSSDDPDCNITNMSPAFEETITTKHLKVVEQGARALGLVSRTAGKVTMKGLLLRTEGAVTIKEVGTTAGMAC